MTNNSYSNNRDNYRKENKRENRRIRKEKTNRKVQSRTRTKKSLNKNFYSSFGIIFVVAIFVLLISILTNNKGNNNKYTIYINNESVTLKNPVDIRISSNGSAKIAMISLEDISNLFDKNIRYNEEKKEIITTGKMHVGKIVVGDFSININGTDSAVNLSAYNEGDKIYLPINDLSTIYQIEVNITDDNKVFLDDISKKKDIVITIDKTKLKKSKNIFSKTLTKLSAEDESVLLKDDGKHYKIRTKDGIIGYINKNNVKSIINIREDNPIIKKPEYNYITNYYDLKQNFDDVKLSKKNDAAFLDLLYIEDSKVYDKYNSDSKGYKIYREKLSDNNIEAIATIKITDSIIKELNTYEKRTLVISQILKKAAAHRLNAIYIEADIKNEKENYTYFIQELRPRLTERGLTLVLNSNEINNNLNIDKSLILMYKP